MEASKAAYTSAARPVRVGLANVRLQAVQGWDPPTRTQTRRQTTTLQSFEAPPHPLVQPSGR